MTNTPHGQVPEALIDLIDAYAETRHRCGGVYNAKTEAARKTVIEALSGVQALSAAPAGWKLVPVEPTDEMLKAADEGDDEYTLRNFGPGVQRVMQGPYDHYCAMLAASPTPPAEQQAAPKAAPGEQNTVPAEWLEQAYREGWAACRDAETIGEEAEDWAFGNSTANSRMIDAQQAAPKQEAQEPVAWMWQHEETGRTGFVDCWQIENGFQENNPQLRLAAKLYATPQPAPAPLSDDDVKDAARYRWLREGNDAKHGAAWHVAVNLYGCEWDAAIDAALAAQGGKV